MPQMTPFSEAAAPRNLGELLSRNTELFPHDTAVIHGGNRFTWAGLNERVNRLANGLSARGVNKGDRLALLTQNNHHWIEATFAGLKIGAVIVPLNYRMAAPELQRILGDCEASMLILDGPFGELFKGLSWNDSEPCPILCTGISQPGMASLSELVQESPDTAPDAEVAGHDLAYISFTSGTTGFPKGVMWTHEGLLSTIPDNPFSRDLCHRSRQLVVSPSFVAGSQILILNGMYNASTMILMDFNPQEVMKAIEHEKPSLMASAAVMLHMLATLPEAGRCDTGSLKRIYYGGSSMGTPERFEQIKKVFPCEFQQGYGSAETCILVSRLNPSDHDHLETPNRTARLTSAGRAYPGAEVRIMGQGGKEVTGTGEVGEVAIKAPWIMKGYWNRPEETSKVFDADGFYLTRDMAHQDQDGYIFIVNRKDDMIKTGGLNVYPSEIEAVITAHESVEEAAVFGIPHQKWQTAVAAVVKLEQGEEASEQDLRDFCKKSIGSYKVPKFFFFTSTPLPRSPLGKVLTGDLKKQYAPNKNPPLKTERKPAPPHKGKDPLRHCRKCEFQEVCEKFCYKYFE